MNKWNAIFSDCYVHKTVFPYEKIVQRIHQSINLSISIIFDGFSGVQIKQRKNTFSSEKKKIFFSYFFR